MNKIYDILWFSQMSISKIVSKIPNRNNFFPFYFMNTQWYHFLCSYSKSVIINIKIKPYVFPIQNIYTEFRTSNILADFQRTHCIFSCQKSWETVDECVSEFLLWYMTNYLDSNSFYFRENTELVSLFLSWELHFFSGVTG